MKFDDYMKESLHEAAAGVTPDPALRTRVLAHAAAPARRRPRRALIAALAVVCLAGSALAAGPVAYLLSGIPRGQIASVEAQQTLETELGYSILLPETMHDATFTEASVLPWKLRDAADSTIGTILTLDASYQDGGSRIHFNAEQAGAREITAPNPQTLIETRVLHDMSVCYYEIPCICVPGGEEDSFTQEERDAEARGALWLSSGSETRAESVYRYAAWEQNGVRYVISAQDYEADWTADDFFAAAQDAIESAS